MKIKALFLMFLSGSFAYGQDDLHLFTETNIIGNTERKPEIHFNTNEQTITFPGSSYKPDEDLFTYEEIEGNFIITASFSFREEQRDHKKELGLMIRSSIDPEALLIKGSLRNDGPLNIEFEGAESNSSEEKTNKITAPKFNYSLVQLERFGTRITARAAHFGEPLQTIWSREMSNLPDTVLAGLFFSSAIGENEDQARVWNIRIEKTVNDDYDPNENGYLGSRLETMNVFNGERKIVYEANERFEAPNWMPNGKELLFNRDGSLFLIPLEGGEPTKLNTGFANRNNNDHGISFNGELLAISHHREGFPGGGSAVYVLPLKGGTPELVTEKTPSYWHGWAPNNEEVVYVASREGKQGYDIYKKSIHGGEEIALTDTGENEHVDGCEYTPDGRFIYYNGSATGTMQIWRMKPDGSQKEQITFDEKNDWFPHISPDGKWIIYISFPPDIPVNDHPLYKRVTLNLIPAAGGPAKVIAYLYGGQGTINVPSWSPDSKHISFVSNFKFD